ncbi:Cyclic nucleotide-binding domain-containing protein [Pseudobutyrivibrio sp. 49]|uniref:Crp/Fnr family transcriptional regulator n=1 Tax=unclassified Pseudobutyrivibrio TaxID=2638619 RepID=UPI00088E2476|nr:MULTISPECIES: cyclic nucleotide-binding domain-containing protein [unclassified Pseudobutyrivibrio]SDH79922.1 Cyclic nucleotide-binding domain-containing protein [Pseudobutyrivibrio sp. 49]SFO02129.1 Cyclic nucleotide-binding domain-containing protein [Pseudobutyrivibrio sp. UC1225]
MVNTDKLLVAPQGMKIIVERQPDKYLYVILSGRAYMYAGYGTKEETIIDKFGVGNCFGAYGMLTKRPDNYTVVAQTDMKLIRLEEADMADFISKENASTVLSVMKAMAKEMVRVKTELDTLNKDIAKRKRVDGEESSEPESIILKDNSGVHRIYNPKNPHFDAKGKMRFLGRDKE